MTKVKIQEVFKVGNPPKDPKLIAKIQHPKNNKKAVRCVLQNNELFFNVGDFLQPFKNKLYEYAIKLCLPSHAKNLKKVWMAQRAWDSIQNIVEKKLSKKGIEDAIIEGVNSSTLFALPPEIKDENNVGEE